MKTIISSLGINRRTLLSALGGASDHVRTAADLFRAGADRSIG